MISAGDVRKLARLSRLSLTDEEVEALRGEMGSIVAYIDVIQKVELPEKPKGSVYLDIENVMRADEAPHEPGLYTQELLAQAPRRKDDYLRVKKILGEGA